MNKRIGQTPFVELLPGSISGDPAIQRVAGGLDAPLDAATRAIPNLLIFSRLARDSGALNPVPLLPPLEWLAALLKDAFRDAVRLALRDIAKKSLFAWMKHRQPNIWDSPLSHFGNGARKKRGQSTIKLAAPCAMPKSKLSKDKK